MVRWVVTLLALGVATGCTDKSEKMKEAQKRRNEEKKTFEKEAEDRRKAAAPKVDGAHLDAFWDDPAFLKVATGKKCPDGLWAVFPSTPGEGAEKDANEAKKAELAQSMRDATFVAVLHHGTGLSLRKYDKKKKTLSVEIDGLLECFDGLGLVSVAWGDSPKPFRPKPSQHPDLSPQAVWRAKPLLVPLSFDSPAEAKTFAQGEGLGTEARVVFKLGKVEVDEKLTKVPPNPEAGTAGGTVDWGAGRLVRVDVLGLRVASDHEKHQLAEQRAQTH